jgi:hypothetical protein
MDLLAFNLSESIHKSIGGNLQAKTDQGLIGLAHVIESFITREIMWEIDPTHRHGFQFLDLTPADALQKAKIRQLYMQIGVTFPNEIRAEDGQDPVPWGDIPYPVVQAKGYDPAEVENDKKSVSDDDGEKSDKVSDDDDEDDS